MHFGDDDSYVQPSGTMIKGLKKDSCSMIDQSDRFPG
jgi:hypothetical protein